MMTSGLELVVFLFLPLAHNKGGNKDTELVQQVQGQQNDIHLPGSHELVYFFSAPC